MKFVALLLIFVGICNAFEDQCRGAYLKSVQEKCLAVNGGDRVVIDELHPLQKSSTENGKCFRACVFKECKYFGSDGKFHDDVAKRSAGVLHGGDETRMKSIEETAAKCVLQQNYDDSDCNIAEDFVQCLIKQTTVPLNVYTN